MSKRNKIGKGSIGSMLLFPLIFPVFFCLCIVISCGTCLQIVSRITKSSTLNLGSVQRVKVVSSIFQLSVNKWLSFAEKEQSYFTTSNIEGQEEDGEVCHQRLETRENLSARKTLLTEKRNIFFKVFFSVSEFKLKRKVVNF